MVNLKIHSPVETIGLVCIRNSQYAFGYIFHSASRKTVNCKLKISIGSIEINQQIALSSILYFSFYDGSYMFRQNDAILRKHLCSFLSHFNVNMVRDKS
jgi:hypothetical protein